MGAACFRNSGLGTKPDPIFEQLHEQALYDYGHSGYTGSIAEKGSFQIRANRPMTEKEADAFIRDDEENNDKWGPAFAIPYCTEEDQTTIVGWIFYGLAPE